jgi:SAM domain (Sterile alpha motif)/Adenylate and Guanylate cyclase catalytic domain
VADKDTLGSQRGHYPSRNTPARNGLEPSVRIVFHRSIARCVGECAAVQEIAEWLDKLGMSEYAQRFTENRIDLSVLPDLTDQDLEKVGVVLGDRRKMLRAIRELGGIAPSAPQSVLAEPKPQDTAERRQVTVMFSDLVGSTALSARMDPEDLREIISAYQKCVTETVRRFDGFLAKYLGDGVLVPLHSGFDSLNLNLSWPELWDRRGPFWRGPFWL